MFYNMILVRLTMIDMGDRKENSCAPLSVHSVGCNAATTLDSLLLLTVKATNVVAAGKN